MKNIVYILYTGTWDSHHVTGIFSTEQIARDYIKKFDITDNPEIKEFSIDPHKELIYSNKIPYRADYEKEGNIELLKKDHYSELYDHFLDGYAGFICLHDNVFGMFYYLSAENDDEALKMAEKMRQSHLSKNWEEEYNKR